jgi:tripartite-type tricarboxylate transporter receptor subunit TctC
VSFATGVFAQGYPARPITMIVPFTPGGSTDTVARAIAEPMREFLGQPIVIENITGADGSIGTGRATRAAPNGYTIVLGFVGTHVMNAALYTLPYDVLADFSPISLLSHTSPLLWGSKNIPATDFDGLVNWLQANPGKSTSAAYTAGSRLFNFLFSRQIGIEIISVPYRGIGPATQDLVAGQINLLIATPESVLAQERAGKVRVFAAWSERRLAIAPEVPTFAEKGVKLHPYTVWLALWAPAGTPREIIVTLNAATAFALSKASVGARLSDVAHEIYPPEMRSPEILGALQKEELAKWLPLFREANIRAE